MVRFGVLGGSFDPVHRGHLYVAQLAREAAALDRVFFVPAARPPHKSDRRLAGADHRVAMLRAALDGEPDSAVLEIELEPDGPVYTVDTLAAVEARHPGCELHFILGLDSLAELPTWRSPDALLARWRTIAVDRPGFDVARIDPRTAERCRIVEGNPFAISATGIRARVAAGLSIRHLVPAPVEAYIREHGLYARS